MLFRELTLAICCAQACDGGLAEGAFEYIMKVGGVRLESDVPYRGAGRPSCSCMSHTPALNSPQPCADIVRDRST